MTPFQFQYWYRYRILLMQYRYRCQYRMLRYSSYWNIASSSQVKFFVYRYRYRYQKLRVPEVSGQLKGLPQVVPEHAVPVFLHTGTYGIRYTSGIDGIIPDTGHSLVSMAAGAVDFYISLVRDQKIQMYIIYYKLSQVRRFLFLFRGSPFCS